jgi:uncharacterized membrane protein
MSRRIRLIFRLLLLVTGANALVAGVAWVLLTFAWPDAYFAAFPVIPLFFWVVGMGMALSLEASHTEKPDSVTMTYMMARGVKLLLTALFVGIYAWFVHTDMKEFGLTTLVFYMVFLVLESYVFFMYEKRRNKRRRAREGDSIPQPEPYAGKEVEDEDVDV